jgi:hypothetical protein
MNRPEPWPKDAIFHEIQSLVKWLGDMPDSPDEVRGEEVEDGFTRPMIQMTPGITGVIQDGQFRYVTRRNVSMTWWGSNVGSDLAAEAYRAADWLTTQLGRNTYDGINGPMVQIWDFSGDEPVETDQWIEIDTATNIFPSTDEFGLWRISVDLRYSVERGEEDPTTPVITNINKKITITQAT